MKKVIGIFVGLIALIIVGVVGVFAFSGSNESTADTTNPISTVVEDAKTAATNAAIDASGIKDTVKSAIESHRDSIAAATGMSTEQVDVAIDSLAIDDWQAASLPSTVSATGTIDGTALGVDGTLTTYDDPSYVTVNAYGQAVTLAVPESAQSYLPYLALAS